MEGLEVVMVFYSFYQRAINQNYRLFSTLSTIYPQLVDKRASCT